MSKPLTSKQYKILMALYKTNQTIMTPTEIGQKCHKPYEDASSWACATLPTLVKQGLVRKHQKPRAYSLRQAGKELCEELEKWGG